MDAQCTAKAVSSATKPAAGGSHRSKVVPPSRSHRGSRQVASMSCCPQGWIVGSFMHLNRSVALASGGLLALAAALGIARFVYTPILPVMLDALGWSKAEAGLVASANYLGYFIGALAAARSFASARPRRW